MTRLAFHRGTSLRLLSYIPRYSKDLDFASLLQRVKAQFSKEGYDADVRVFLERQNWNS
ncbi:MAG: hypothetical protein QF473_10585 [Planctomycetota bacterium]|jgi:predicted nucleotidyltransferase component of viral defense system|nr:hypothetical protein [Planctomycetota bacterium]